MATVILGDSYLDCISFEIITKLITEFLFIAYFYKFYLLFKSKLAKIMNVRQRFRDL